jgi:murein DD-endopeptidase MepM/ murein hydrolase activator NlpD
MTWNKRAIAGFLGMGMLVVAGIALLVWHTGFLEPAPALHHSSRPSVFVPASFPKTTIQDLPFSRGDTLSDLLNRAGVAEPEKTEMIVAARGAFDLKKFRAGEELKLTRSSAGSLKSIEYVIDPDHKLQIVPGDSGFRAAVVVIPGITRTVPVCGTMQSSLFESMDRIGEQPELAMEMADIFAFDLDFYTDPQDGDRFCMLVEKTEYANGQPPTYRRIVAATYNNNGTLYEAFLFKGKDGKARYYARDGRSLESPFLKSPLKFEARISSHFSLHRFHPILKIYRPHLGTDYAAPTGTPVQAVAAGRVVSSGYAGGGGNMIRIRHSNGYETYYMHLSRRLVRAGEKVDQGQRIGLVGMTGLATGPHLDFRVRKNGNFVNFERLRLPPAAILTADQKAAFNAERDHDLALIATAAHADSALAKTSTSEGATVTPASP